MAIATKLSTGVSIDETSVAYKFQNFFKERSKQKAELYIKIISIGWSLMVFGFFLIVLGAIMNMNYIVMALASFVVSAGLCTFSTIPTDEFDIDEFTNRHPLVRGGMCALIATLGLVYAAVFGVFSPHIGILGAFMAVWILMAAFGIKSSHLSQGEVLGIDVADSKERLTCDMSARTSILTHAPVSVYNAFLHAKLTTRLVIFGNFAFFNVVVLFSIQAFAPQYMVDSALIAGWMNYKSDWADYVNSRPSAQVGNALQALTFGIGGIVSNYYCWKFYHSSSKCQGWRTANLYFTLYCWLNSTGIGQIMFGIYSWAGYPVTIVPIDYKLFIITAFFILVPTILVMCLGPKKCFSLMARYFEHDKSRLEEDGALMAELVSACQVLDLDSMARWEYRSSENKGAVNKVGFINLSFWVLGRIVAGHDEGSEDKELTLEFDFKENAQLSSARYNGCKFESTATIGTASAGGGALNFDEWTQANFGDVIAKDSKRQVVSLKRKLAARGSTRGDLLKWARENLRSFQWKASEEFDPELLGRSPRELKTDEEKIKLYGLSKDSNIEGCKIQIDYFISHSWFDNATIKCDQMSKFAKKFYAEHGRMPVFWFDKTCINQMDTANALAVLPINIAASKKMLILMGESYMTRLWCIWELFTLFTFSNKELAMERIEVLNCSDPKLIQQEQDRHHRFSSDDPNTVNADTLHIPTVTDVMVKHLRDFKIADANAFDPNEEFKLRQIIYDVGINRLYDSLHAIADVMERNSAGFD